MNILIEALQKKKDVLNGIGEKNKQQAEILKAEHFSMDDFDRNVEEKEKLISALVLLDEGFESVYERIREELMQNRNAYKMEIAQLQELISEITDMSVSIQAQEARNKQAVETVLRNERAAIRSDKKSSKTALDYYKSMNQVNYIDPQFMDQKK